MRSLILQPNEEIAVVFRQTPLVLWWQTAILLGAIGVPSWYVLHYELVAPAHTLLGIWVLIVVVWWVRHIYLWSVERYIVTTKRFVKVSHESVFRHVVTETALDRILNISFRTTGMLSVMGRFGDIELQVVGLLNPIVVENIADPTAIKEFLWRLHEKAVAARGVHQPGGPQFTVDYTKPNQRMPD